MPLYFPEDIVGPDWVIERGSVLWLDPIKEANWAAAGHGWRITEEEAETIAAAAYVIDKENAEKEENAE